MRKDIHVVFIGLDGWGSYDLEQSFAHMPHVKTYAREGIYTDNKIAVLPTISAPNWASMFMGAHPDEHGFIQNTKKPSISYSFEVKNRIFPTISQLVRNEDPTSNIGLFCQWGGLLYLVDTKSIDCVCHIPRLFPYSHRMLTNKVIRYVKESMPVLCTIVYDDLDHKGHKYGYFSDKYFQGLEYMDESIERIIEAYKEAGIYENTVFILTSDHGGNGRTHGSNSLKEMKTPLIMWGKRIRNIGFCDDEIEQKDVAAIMATILNVKMPAIWSGNSHLNYLNC